MKYQTIIKRAILVIVLFGLTILSAFSANIDLWIMSQCPYGAQAVFPVAKLKKNFIDNYNLGDEYQFKVHYILKKEGNELRSLHGAEEVEEDLRQLVIQKHFPEKFWCYLQSRSSHYSDSFWMKDARVCGLKPRKIIQLVQSEGKELASQEIKLSDSLGVTKSPTLFINGKREGDWKGDFPSLYMLVKNLLISEGTEKAHLDTSEPISSLPECFEDTDCLPSDGKTFSKCINNKCISQERPTVKLNILIPDTFYTKLTKKMEQVFGRLIPQLKVSYIKHDSKKGKRMIKKMDLNKLPAYYFDKSLNRAQNFNKLRNNLLKIRSKDALFYLANPPTVKHSYFMERSLKKGKLDLFIMSDCQFSRKVIDSLYSQEKTEGVKLHYVIERDRKTGDFTSLHGRKELKEAKRQITIQKFYPDKIWDYLHCYNSQEDANFCLNTVNINKDSLQRNINEYADSLLARDLALKDSLKIKGSPSFLWENKYLISGVEGLEKIYNIPISNSGKCQGK